MTIDRAIAIGIATAALVLVLYGAFLTYWETYYSGNGPELKPYSRQIGHDCFLNETYYPYQFVVFCQVYP